MHTMPPESDGRTADAAIAWATAELSNAGVEGPARDARILVSAATGMDRVQLLARPDVILSGPQIERVHDFVRRRRRREPVSRILGHRAFYGREFAISPSTLDPRPDSETLIDAALELLAEDGANRDARLRIVDIGTGSGCLLVTLLAELPHAAGLGTDIDPEALLLAKGNASAHGVTERAEWSVSRSLEGLDGPFDLLIANPPYIPTGDIASLEPEVRDHDPRSALDGGCDGLDVYREIAAGLLRVVPEGWAIFEVGAGQADLVKTLLTDVASAPATPLVRVFRDLNGVDRCVAWKARH